MAVFLFCVLGLFQLQVLNYATVFIVGGLALGELIETIKSLYS